MNVANDALFDAAAAVLSGAGLDVDGSLSELWRANADGTLRLQRCMSCGYVRLPAAPRCPDCLGRNWQWSVERGTGSVWSFCVYHRAFHPAFRDALPYNVALVELDAGPRLVTNVVGDVDGLRVGARGTIRPIGFAGGRTLFYFDLQDLM